MDKSKMNITDRIKTFDDALEELGKDHPLVKEYKALCKADVTENTVVYSRLCVITAAMNEGWEPKFIREEYRYFPYFYLHSEEDIIRMSEERKSRVVCLSYGNTSEYGGVSFIVAGSYPTGIIAYIGPRLAFKTKELAEYAGKQFADLYADYLLGE